MQSQASTSKTGCVIMCSWDEDLPPHVSFSLRTSSGGDNPVNVKFSGLPQQQKGSGSATGFALTANSRKASGGSPAPINTAASEHEQHLQAQEQQRYQRQQQDQQQAQADFQLQSLSPMYTGSGLQPLPQEDRALSPFQGCLDRLKQLDEGAAEGAPDGLLHLAPLPGDQLGFGLVPNFDDLCMRHSYSQVVRLRHVCVRCSGLPLCRQRANARIAGCTAILIEQAL